MSNTETRIYLTDLAAYNEGALVGKWIDLPCDNLDEELAMILKTGEQVTKSPNHEEYFITDSEAPFEINEHSSLDEVNELAKQFEELNEQDQKKIKFLEWQGNTTEQALQQFEDVCIYEDMSYEDLAYEQVEEGMFGEVPAHLANYLDYDAIARDLSCDYTDLDGDLFYNYY